MSSGRCWHLCSACNNAVPVLAVTASRVLALTSTGAPVCGTGQLCDNCTGRKAVGPAVAAARMLAPRALKVLVVEPRHAWRQAPAAFATHGCSVDMSMIRS